MTIDFSNQSGKRKNVKFPRGLSACKGFGELRRNRGRPGRR